MAALRAIARDAKIYGEIVGFGMSNDAYHMTAPRPDGMLAARSMRRSRMQHAKCWPNEPAVNEVVSDVDNSDARPEVHGAEYEGTKLGPECGILAVSRTRTHSGSDAMRQILFVQGGGKDVHERWDNKLVESLRQELGPGYDVRYPRMPNEDDPKLAAWEVALESEIAALQSGAIVVGHSIGGTILINVLAERAPSAELGAIVLVAAPFIGDGGWKSDEIEPRSDLGARLPNGVPVLLYHGDKDTTVPITHVELYAVTIPNAHVRRLANRDHQLNNDLSEVASDIREL